MQRGSCHWKIWSRRFNDVSCEVCGDRDKMPAKWQSSSFWGATDDLDIINNEQRVDRCTFTSQLAEIHYSKIQHTHICYAGHFSKWCKKYKEKHSWFESQQDLKVSRIETPVWVLDFGGIRVRLIHGAWFALCKDFFTLFKKLLKLSHLIFFLFWHFPPIFVLLKLTCLATLFDRKLWVFQKLVKLIIF